MSNNKFKLGLDVHGVIDSIPNFFSFLSESFIKNGGEVHIITGGSWSENLQKQLNSYGIKWTHHFSVYDYMLENNYKYSGNITFNDGTVQKRFNDSDWNKVKAEYCSKNNISLHIDDKTIYNDNFKTPFCKLWLNKD
jgi:hypothetical protein